MTSNISTLSDNQNPLADGFYPSADSRIELESALHDVKNLATVLFAYLEREDVSPEIEAALSITAQIERRAGKAIAAYLG